MIGYDGGVAIRRHDPTDNSLQGIIVTAISKQ
jgi:hypothetical protein